MTDHPLLDSYLTQVLNRAERLAGQSVIWAPLGLQQELWALLTDARCVQRYVETLVAARSVVHTHGSEEGPGLACPERMVAGRLQGECVARPGPTTGG